MTELPNFVTSIDKLGTHEEWLALIKPHDSYTESYKIRSRHIKYLGFPILIKETMDSLAKFIGIRKVADLGCSTDYLTAALQRLAIDVKAYDSFSTEYTGADFKRNQHCKITQVNMQDVDLTLFDGVILSWPDYESNSAFKIAERLTAGQFLIYQGEGSYGCTADEDFHELIYGEAFTEQAEINDALNETHVQFHGLHDYWQVFVKN